MTILRYIECDVCGKRLMLRPFGDTAEDVVRAEGWGIIPKNNGHICKNCLDELGLKKRG